MNIHSRASLQQALENQIRRLDQKINHLEGLSNRLSMARLLFFIGGLVLVYLSGTFGPEWVFWATLLIFILGFGKLVRKHRHIDGSIQKFTGWKTIRETHLARQQMNWAQLPHRSTTKDYSAHPFGNDLDIIGNHSLLQLIDTSTYQGSTDLLGKYLLTTAPVPEETIHRQEVVKGLAKKPQFRDKIHLYGRLNHQGKEDTDWSIEKLLHHLERAEPVDYRSSLWLLGSLSALNLILGVLYLAGILDPYVIFTFVLYLVLYNFNSDKISGLYKESNQIQKLLSRFSGILQYLENYPYRSGSKLKDFCRPFWDSEFSPSRYIRKIVAIASAASSQQSELVWLLFNMLVPWDLYFAQKLSSYKQDLAPRLSEWVQHFYQLEALSGLANFAWLNPHYHFAIPDDGAARPFQAEALGHPLLPEEEKVTNDVSINEKGDILLITGSNMAGKSTFLRTMGINLALCFAGGPVNASSLTTIPFRLFSSINISDSLNNGLSHFYAEVKRLKDLLQLLNDNHSTPVFFMVDEIYRGTNNRERLQGSRAFLENVAGKNGVGLVSTHDLELAQLERRIPELTNWHFEETIEEGKMSFEYKLKAGPCPTTNALKIMEMEGLPI